MQVRKAIHLQQLAHDRAERFDIPLGQNFHALDSFTVERILSAANEARYRKPRNANGSRARYFYAKLNRDACRAYAGFL